MEVVKIMMGCMAINKLYLHYFIFMYKEGDVKLPFELTLFFTVLLSGPSAASSFMYLYRNRPCLAIWSFTWNNCIMQSKKYGLNAMQWITPYPHWHAPLSFNHHTFVCVRVKGLRYHPAGHSLTKVSLSAPSATEPNASRAWWWGQMLLLTSQIWM